MWRASVVARRGLLSSRHKAAIENPLINLSLPLQEELLHNRRYSDYQFHHEDHMFDYLHSHFTKRTTTFHSQARFFSSEPYHDIPVTESQDVHFDSSDHTTSTAPSGEDPDGYLSEREEISSILDGFSFENGDNLEGLGDGIDPLGVTEEHETEENDADNLEKVLSLLQSSGPENDKSFESDLDGMRLALNEKFVQDILEAPLVPGGNLIRFFRWAMEKPDFSVTKSAFSQLIKAVCVDVGKTKAYALWDLVKEIGEKESGLLSTENLNDLIVQFAKMGKGKAAYEVFNKFESFGCAPNVDTYYFTIQALCRRSIFSWASDVCEKMVHENQLPDGERVGRIISDFCKGKKATIAHMVYMAAKEKKIPLPRSAVSFLISSLCQSNETIVLALKMLEDIPGEERKFAVKPYQSVIQALCRMKNVEGEKSYRPEDVEDAKKLLSKMVDDGPPPGNAVFNFVINGLSKLGDMEEAIKLMKVMEDRGLKPDVYSYSVIISGYAKGGAMEEACKVLDEAKKKHSKLSPVTYHTLVRGYCKLEQFDKAIALLGEMENYGVKPNVDEYNKLIQSLCLKAVDWEMAEKLLEEMKEKGLHLNGITKGLIRAVKELEEEVGQEDVIVAV